MKKNLIVFSFFILLFFGCKSERNISEPQPQSLDFSNLSRSSSKENTAILTPADYYQFLAQKANVRFSLSGNFVNIYYPEMTIDQSSAYSLQGEVYPRIGEYNETKFFGESSIQNITIPFTQREGAGGYTTSGEYSNLYGNVLKFDVPTPSGKNYQDSIYVPKTLHLESPICTNSNPELNTDKDVLIKWNIDEKNQNGILIVIRYEPNQNDLPNSVPPYVFAESIADSKGSYTISKDILQKIPKGRRGEIITLRGGFKSKVINSKQVYKIHGVCSRYTKLWAR
jgi:hypothetical protein